MTTPGVVASTMPCLTCARVALGVPDSNSAATVLAWGAAIDVLESASVSFAPVFDADSISTPDAERVTRSS